MTIHFYFVLLSMFCTIYGLKPPCDVSEISAGANIQGGLGSANQLMAEQIIRLAH